jgi:DUF917 family protein
MGFEIRGRDITALALGSGVLGCGGGGNSYYGQLFANRLLSGDSVVRLINIEEMEADFFAITSAAIGASLVCLEKPPSLAALRAGLDSVLSVLGGRLGGFVAGEIGGLQCMLPLLLAASTGVPLIDGDGIGRAFPELQMTTFAIYGTTPGLPSAVSSDRGLLFAGSPESHVDILDLESSDQPAEIRFERLMRKICAQEGGLIYLTAALDHQSLIRTLVRGTISLALRIGRAIETARAASSDPIEAIVLAADGKRFVRGKIVDIERQFRKGHDWGTVVIDGVDEHYGQKAEIAFKNEYLILKVDDEISLTVPDLITVVETETGTPVSTDILRPGLRVTVLGLSCSPLLSTPLALKSVGPPAFGYSLPYVALR